MKADEASVTFQRLMDPLLGEAPSATHLADEFAPAARSESATRWDCPRLSFCVEGTGRYWVRKRHLLVEKTVRRGEAIFALPKGFMEPHPRARYRAFGLVFYSQMTHFLLAEKVAPRNAPPRHRFLLSHHCPAALDEDGRNLCRAIARCHGRPAADPYLACLVHALLWKARELLDSPPEPSPEGKARFTWQAACHFVEGNFRRPLSRNDLADALHIHPNHVSRLFTRFSRMPFNRYVLETRLREARELLRDPAINVSEIAQACGFSDTNYFIQCYRKVYGQTPGRARVGAA